jgi:hypothetical protein
VEDLAGVYAERKRPVDTVFLRLRASV